MVLQRWDPVADIRRFERTSDRLLRGFGVWGLPYGGPVNGALPVDVQEGDDNIVVQASLPGVSPEAIQVTIDDGVLTISSESQEEQETEHRSYLVRERRNGSYRRSIRLPDSADPDKAESSYEHGVLTVTFPKQEAKKAKRLEVKAA